MYKVNQERRTGIIIWLDIQRETSMILTQIIYINENYKNLFNQNVVFGWDISILDNFVYDDS